MTDVLIRLDPLTRDAAVGTTTELPCQSAAAADLFFSETPAELEHAKTLCVGCPLQRECLDGALARREPWGVWGGAILQAGEVIARKRPRGRPRKNAA